MAIISAEHATEFSALYEKFGLYYLSQDRGQAHLARYNEVREQGRKNFQEVVDDARRIGVPTDKVLRKLLPHTDSAAHRQSEAWIHVAPAIQGDIRDWFEAAGWTQAQDWPKVATAILSLILTCIETPSKLAEACQKFVGLPYTTGLQTGILTPILNALKPDAFLIINNKSRRVINYFAGTSFKQRLTDYPKVNATGLDLISILQERMNTAGTACDSPPDLFDMFCHWLVAERRYPAVTPGGAREERVRTSSGEAIVAVPEEVEDEGVQAIGQEAQSRESHKMQSALAMIGSKMGFQVWIPRSDRERVLELAPTLHEFLLDDLPLNYIDMTLRTISNIDVIWIRKHSIARAFEVEHTTAIYSGLLRMADLLALQPDINIRLHIVAPDHKREKVMREIKRPIFGQLEKLPLYKRCSFISYPSVTELQKLHGLEYMHDAVLTEYEEFAEEE